MAEVVKCRYYNGGYCNLSGVSQSQSQVDYYCVTPKEKENWYRCANYTNASAEDKIRYLDTMCK
jgi:hypothetical protein